VADGLRVCVVCLSGAQRDLSALPGLYHSCERALTASASAPKTQRVSRSLSYGIALNVGAVDARDLVRSRLLSWCDLVVDERGCTPPDRSVAALSTFLHRHIRWLCAHSAAYDAVTEIAEMASAARSAANPHRSRKFRVGPCVEAGCDGDLIAVIHSSDRLLPSEVRCAADSQHVWPATRWRELDRRVNNWDAGSTRWLSVTEVTQLWGLSTSNVYRLASIHDWRRRVRGRRVLYYEPDIVESVK
jgi:predicted DNA-binding transcriptional regulator AlpA